MEDKKVNGKDVLKKKNDNKEQAENIWPVGVTEDMIEGWRTEHPKAKIVPASIPVDDSNTEFHQVVLRSPGRHVMGMWEKFMDRDPDKSKKILIDHCCLFGKERVLAPNNDYLFFACATTIGELMPIGQGIIKNY